MPAKSYSVIFPDLTAKSGLPTSPKNKVSPVYTECDFPFESFNKKQVLSNVCPGVCNTYILQFPKLNSSLSFAT